MHPQQQEALHVAKAIESYRDSCTRSCKNEFHPQCQRLYPVCTLTEGTMITDSSMKSYSIKPPIGSTKTESESNLKDGSLSPSSVSPYQTTS